jgi:hypothetical protein
MGPISTGGSALACQAWIEGGTGANTGYLVRQAGSNRWIVQTNEGEGNCQLVETVTGPGQMSILVKAEGYTGRQNVRKITDTNLYTFTDGNFYGNWRPVNGEVVYGDAYGTSKYWAAAYGDLNMEQVGDVAVSVEHDSQGNMFIAGNFFAGPFIYPYIAKMKGREFIWQKFLAIDEFDPAIDTVVRCDGDDNIILAITEITAPTNKLVILKLDTDANILWQRSLSGITMAMDMSVDSDGSIAISDADSPAVVKYDANGTLLWKKQFGNNNGGAGNVYIESSQGLAFTSNHHLAVSLPFNSPAISDGIAVAFLDADGNLLTTKSMRETSITNGYATRFINNVAAMDYDAGGNVYVSTTSYDDCGCREGFFKFGPTGTVLAKRSLNDIGDNRDYVESFAIAAAPDGSTFAAGWAYNRRIRKGGISIKKRNPDGSLAWQRILSDTVYIDQKFVSNTGIRDISIHGDVIGFAGYGRVATPGYTDNNQHGILANLPEDGGNDGCRGVFGWYESRFSDYDASSVVVEDLTMGIADATYITETISDMCQFIDLETVFNWDVNFTDFDWIE